MKRKLITNNFISKIALTAAGYVLTSSENVMVRAAGVVVMITCGTKVVTDTKDYLCEKVELVE